MELEKHKNIEKDFESRDLFKIYVLMFELKERLAKLETKMSLARCEENENIISKLTIGVNENALMIERAKNAVTFSVISIIIGLISSSAALIAAFKVFV